MRGVINLREERKKLCLFTAINFTLGIIMGIVLFYGQQRSNSAVFEGNFEYSTALELMDFFRLSWINLLWLFSIFIARNILLVSSMHPIMLLRGCMSSFSLMYIFTYIGVKEGIMSAMPQCFSILPLLMFFSVETARKQRLSIETGGGTVTLKKGELFLMMFGAMLSGGIEMVLFRALSLGLSIFY